MQKWLVGAAGVGAVAVTAALLLNAPPKPTTFAWDASVGATGYEVTPDGGTPIDAGANTTLTVALAEGPHTATVAAYNGAGLRSAQSSPVLAFTVAPGATIEDPACVLPLGNRAVSIFVTSLQATGSGGAGSKAYLNFQVASPNSPVTHLAVQSRGVDLPQGTMDGGPPAYLNAAPGLWFVVPSVPGTYPLSVQAKNLYGCLNTLVTTRSVVVP